MKALPILLGVAIFALGCALVEYLRPRLRGEPISSGLNGRYHLYLIASFLALSAGLIETAFAVLPWQPWPMLAGPILANVVALAVAGAAVSDGWSFLIGQPLARSIHLKCAAVAFIGALGLEPMMVLAAPSHHVLLWCIFALYPLATAFTKWKWPNDTELQEKTATGSIDLFIFAWALVVI